MAAADIPTGEQIRRAREARRMTQEELARALGVGVRSVGRWERGENVPRSAIGALQQILGLGEAPAPSGPALTEASDSELLAEIARRFERSTAREDLPPLPGSYRWPKPTSGHRKKRAEDG